MQHDPTDNFLNQVFKAVAEAGADRIDIPDTVGYSTPKYISELVTDVIKCNQITS